MIVQAFATLSDSRRHDAAAIWAHIKPVYDAAKEDSSLENLHFLSDGPTTQYRNKNNFFLLARLPFEWGSKNGEWSFSEAGHGKGAPDGIGGALKRPADRLEAEGNDRLDAASLRYLLRDETAVQLQLVEESDIEDMDDIIHEQSDRGSFKISDRACLELFHHSNKMFKTAPEAASMEHGDENYVPLPILPKPRCLQAASEAIFLTFNQNTATNI